MNESKFSTEASGHAVEIATASAPVKYGGPAPLILCDHARNALPAEYGSLGLPPAQFDRHIAYDIGSAGVARSLAQRLGVSAIMSRWSRLLIDLNRGPDDPTLIMRLSDGAIIPGNRNVDAAERERRIDRFWRPYHSAIGKYIDDCLATGQVPLLVSIHTFTPVWRGVSRPWHAAVLWDKDPRLALPLIEHLRTDPAMIIGDNEPYSGKLRGDTMWQHGTQRGIAHAIIEIRQDLVEDDTGQRAWAERIASVLENVLAEPAAARALGRIEFHGSHTDRG